MITGEIVRHALIELCKNRSIIPELIELLIKTK